MKMNYIVLLNMLNSSLKDNGCDILEPYTDVELTDTSAKLICEQIKSETGVSFSSVKDASNPEIVSDISNYYCSSESQEQFHRKISEKTILKSMDINGDGKPEKVIVSSKDIEDMSNDKLRTKATIFICSGVLLACFSYIFFVTFGKSFIDPDVNARFVDQILSNINSVINMIVMFIAGNFFAGMRYSRKNKEEDNDASPRE